MLSIIIRLFLASIGLLSLFAEKAIEVGQRSRDNDHATDEESEEFIPDVVDSVDLQRYAGTWYEIARLPNFFEKTDMTDIKAEYELLEDGSISVTNSSVRGNGAPSSVMGEAKSTDDSNAKLKVAFAPAFLRFLPFVWGDYWILDLDTEYQWSVVGGPTNKHLWILSRTPSMSDELYSRLCQLASDKGFDTQKLIRPVHSLAENE